MFGAVNKWALEFSSLGRDMSAAWLFLSLWQCTSATRCPSDQTLHTNYTKLGLPGMSSEGNLIKIIPNSLNSLKFCSQWLPGSAALPGTRLSAFTTPWLLRPTCLVPMSWMSRLTSQTNRNIERPGCSTKRRRSLQRGPWVLVTASSENASLTWRIDVSLWSGKSSLALFDETWGSLGSIHIDWWYKQGGSMCCEIL